MAKVKYSGVAIDAGDTPLIVPPLSLGQVEALDPVFQIIDDTSQKASVRIAHKMTVIHAAATRNYPEITVEELKHRLDLGNINGAYVAALGVSAENSTRGE